MSGIFEHLALYDDGDRVALRKAAAVAAKRAQDHFGAFLANAADPFEAQVRRELVAAEVEQVIQAVAAEHSVDPDLIRESTWEHLPRGEKGQWNAQGEEDKDLDAELAKAPSAVGDDVGEGTLASFRVADFCTDCFKTKCECKDKDDDDDDDDDDSKESHVKTACCGNCSESCDCDEASCTCESSKKRHAADQPSGDLGPVKRQDIGSDTKPGFSRDRHRKSPVKTEGAGSPNPTVTQDPYDKPDWNADPFAQTDAVTKSQDLPGNDGDAGFNDGGVEHGDHTDTWTGTDGLADPVTNKALSSVDVDKNPIAEFLPDIDSLIAEYEGDK